ncbi:MAG: hypothetical protein IKT43_00130 [Clostridia bacterium]|nr:hypothetical protein [Clostridia bacterium]
MTKTTLIGNRHITAPLIRAVRAGRVASAYLIEGPAGSGKRTLAEYLTALFVCSAPTEDGPCFSCRDCENVAYGSHPDVMILLPEKDRDHVSVETARRANEVAQTAPIHAARRVFVIPDAAKMNAAAQNALLKNLEEPRSSSVYILLCEEAAGVLATIRSRSVIYRTELFSEEVLTRELAARFPAAAREDITLAARLSGGALGQAVTFFGDRKVSDCRKKAEEYLSLICENASFDRFCAVLGADTKKDFLPMFYRILLSGVRDLLLADVSSERQFFPPDQLLSCKKSARSLMKICDRLCELLDPAMANANVAASVFSLNAACSEA